MARKKSRNSDPFGVLARSINISIFELIVIVLLVSFGIFYLAGATSPYFSQGMHLPMMKVDPRTAGLGNEVIWNFYPEVVTSDDAFEICNFLCEANNEEFCSRPLRLDTDANGEADREYTCGQLKMKCNKLSC